MRRGGRDVGSGVGVRTSEGVDVDVGAGPCLLVRSLLGVRLAKSFHAHHCPSENGTVTLTANTNGRVFANGQPVKKPVELKHNMRVWLGNNYAFRFVFPGKVCAPCMLRCVLCPGGRPVRIQTPPPHPDP